MNEFDDKGAEQKPDIKDHLNRYISCCTWIFVHLEETWIPNSSLMSLEIISQWLIIAKEWMNVKVEISENDYKVEQKHDVDPNISGGIFWLFMLKDAKLKNESDTDIFAAVISLR